MSDIIDPYRNYPFRLSWDAGVVAGVSQVTDVDVGASPGHAPAIVTLRRGLSMDTAFQAWIKNPGSDPRDFYLAIVNEKGEKVTGYKLLRCRLTKFVAPDPFEMDGQLLIETLEMQNEGVLQDTPTG